MNWTTALLGTLFLSNIATAQTAPEQEVNIVGFKHPERRSYQSFVRALSAAERYNALAPQAELGFQLLSKPAGKDLTLRLVGNAAELPIPLDPQGYFHLEKQPAIDDDKADLVASAKAGAASFKPSARTPGLPPSTRRLGDLRLECEMLWALDKDELPFLIRSTFQLAGGLCHSGKIEVSFHEPVKLRSATLIEADRTLKLQVQAGRRGYVVPVHDQSWSNEARVVLEPAVDGDNLPR